jgi:hypothetical protein
MQASSSTFNQQGGTLSAPSSDGYQAIVNMVNHTKEEDVELSTRSHDYSNPESTKKVKKTSDPQGPLHIEKPEKEVMTHIPKGVYKRVSHNPNA